MVTNLKVIRLSLEWGQDETAKKLNMSRQWYSLLENGRYIPSDALKQRMEKVFGESADKLLKRAELKGVSYNFGDALKEAL